MEAKAVTDIKKLEEQLTTARESAKVGFLAAVNETLANLKAIGFEYQLVAVEGQETAKNGHVCSLCGKGGHSKRTCPQKEAA